MVTYHYQHINISSIQYNLSNRDIQVSALSCPDCQVSWLDKVHKEPFQVKETRISCPHWTSVLFTQVSAMTSCTVNTYIHVHSPITPLWGFLSSGLIHGGTVYLNVIYKSTIQMLHLHRVHPEWLYWVASSCTRNIQIYKTNMSEHFLLSCTSMFLVMLWSNGTLHGWALPLRARYLFYLSKVSWVIFLAVHAL